MTMIKTRKTWSAMAACMLLCACATGSQETASTASALQAAQSGAYPVSGNIDGLYDRVFIYSDVGEASPRVVDIDEIADMLEGYDVVFFGEHHRHSGIHLAQMQLLQRLYKNRPDIAISMEHFETDTQGYMDAYLKGELGETAMSQDARAWDNYRTSYRPMVEFARLKGFPVIAAEAPTPMVSCVGQYGTRALDEYPPERRALVAQELHIEPGAYQDKYFGATGRHGGVSKAALNSFSAQLLRDATMADSIHKHVLANPGRQVMHINGNFHSASFLGTPERLLKRNPHLKIAVINPIEVELGEDLSVSTEELATGTFVMLVYPTPEMFVSEERQAAWFKEVMKKRSCDLTLDVEEPQ